MPRPRSEVFIRTHCNFLEISDTSTAAIREYLGEGARDTNLDNQNGATHCKLQQVSTFFLALQRKLFQSLAKVVRNVCVQFPSLNAGLLGVTGSRSRSSTSIDSYQPTKG
jgi:hypothetical protein